jgi:hypothetical protein
MGALLLHIVSGAAILASVVGIVLVFRSPRRQGKLPIFQTQTTGIPLDAPVVRFFLYVVLPLLVATVILALVVQG